MLEYFQGFSLLAALLVMTLRMGINPFLYFLDSLCFSELDKQQLNKCTENDVNQDRRNKQKKGSKPEEKQPVTFRPIFITEKNASYMPTQFIFKLFLSFFVSCVVIVTIAIVFSFTKFKNEVEGFTAPFILSFCAMLIIAIMSSFASNYNKFVKIGFPIVAGFAICGVVRAIPTGPCDISLICPSFKAAKIAAFVTGTLLGAVYLVTIFRFFGMKDVISYPSSAIFRVSIFKEMALKIIQSIKGKVELVATLCPTNVFIYLTIRFKVTQCPGWIIDAGFLVTEAIMSLVRVYVAKGCVQMWIIDESVKVLLKIETGRSTKALNEAMKENNDIIEAICPTVTAFLVHPLITCIMILVYIFSCVYDGSISVYARIISLAIITASDFMMAFSVLLKKRQRRQ